MQSEPRTTNPKAHLQRSLAALLARSGGRPTLRAVPFWLTVCLPWVILSLTLAGVASDQPTLLASLVGLTLVSAVLGHDYSQR